MSSKKNTNFYIVQKSRSDGWYVLYLKIGMFEIVVTKEFTDKKIVFYSLTDMAKQYKKTYGSGGVEAINKLLGLKYFTKKMAEGYGFENPVYKDDYDFDEDTIIDTGKDKYGGLPDEKYSYVKPGDQMEKLPDPESHEPSFAGLSIAEQKKN